jgi:hypothetical protein
MKNLEKSWIKPQMWWLIDIADLKEKLEKDLPAHAKVVRFELVWFDKSGYANQVEYNRMSKK